ncbi:MAG: hypothetical protein JNM41_01920 [Flavipsychrobacter sp.]|nr:hypothetical protein [Flavipsychrobacter sp.]
MNLTNPAITKVNGRNMKTLDFDTVISVINRILDGVLSREDAATWAMDLRIADDKGEVQYHPAELQPLLWESILFLEGVDLKDAPDSYLHNEHDIREFLKSLQK